MSELICENIKTIFAVILFTISVSLLLLIADKANQLCEKRNQVLINPYKYEISVKGDGSFNE